MNPSDKIRRYSADKLAFLGLLVLTVLIARLITTSRSKLLFSEPIILNESGLSISIPVGNGWKSEKKWNYYENAFSLSSDFLPTAGLSLARAECRLLLAAAKTDPQTSFNQRASALEGVIVQTDRKFTDAFALDWAHITDRRTRSDIFVGMASLPYNRRLDIEVRQAIDEVDLARRIFERIATGIRFEENQLLKKGSQIVEQIKNAGIGSSLHNRRQEGYYLVKMPEKGAIGFLVEEIADSPESELNITAKALLHLRDRAVSEQTTFLQSNDSFDEFVWEGQGSSFFGRTRIQLRRTGDGALTVVKVGPRPGQNEYLPGTAAIPADFFELFLNQMLRSGHNELVVDLLMVSRPDGEIVPALVRMMDAPEINEKKARYQFRVELLDERGFFDHVYLDDSKRIYKRILVKADETYIVERSSLKEVTELFPERLDVILQKKSMLRRNQLKF